MLTQHWFPRLIKSGKDATGPEEGPRIIYLSLDGLFSQSTEGSNIAWNVSMLLVVLAPEQLSAWLWSWQPEPLSAAPENSSIEKYEGPND